MMPFKHWIFDNCLSADDISVIMENWPAEMQVKESKTSIKSYCDDPPKKIRRIIERFQTDEFCAWLSDLTGINSLIADTGLHGAGLHQINRGGYLKMHVDFNLLKSDMYRRVNLLIYLNDEWSDSWGGQLLLGKEGDVSVSPIAGRCAIFVTSEDSWHGHPDPLNCPDDRSRKSIALYYYTVEKPDWFTAKHTTVYE
jgi:Rps23 Pro-64 3,4-dihydroxylase Tpa1-like proline 4-hydroxylase